MLGPSDDAINFTANEHGGAEQFLVSTNENVRCCLHTLNREQPHQLQRTSLRGRCLCPEMTTGMGRSPECYDFLDIVQLYLWTRRGTTVSREGTLVEKLHRQDPNVVLELPQNKNSVRRYENYVGKRSQLPWGIWFSNVQQQDKSKNLRICWYPAFEVYLCIQLAKVLIGDFGRLHLNSHSRFKGNSL